MEKLLSHFRLLRSIFSPHTKSEPTIYLGTYYRIIAQYTEVKLHSAIATKQKSSS